MCFAPIIGTNKAVDFVIDQGGTLLRIQVKKASIRNAGSKKNVVPCIMSSTNGTRYAKYREAADYTGAIDFYAFVCLELSAIWLVPLADITVTSTWSKALSKVSELDGYIF